MGRPARHQCRPAPGRLRQLADEVRTADEVSSVQLHHGGLRADPRVSGVGRWRRGRRGEGGACPHHRRGPGLLSTRSSQPRAGPNGPASTGWRCTAPTATWSRSSWTLGTTSATTGTAGRAEDRSRFLLEILEGIRQSTGRDFQLGLRLSPERFGIDLDEATTLAASADGRRAPGLPGTVALGRPEATARASRTTVCCSTTSPRCRGHGVRLGYAGKVLAAADVAWCLEHAADFVTVGTAAIIHHDFARRAWTDPDFVSDAAAGHPGPPRGRVRRACVHRVPRDQLGRLRALVGLGAASRRDPARRSGTGWSSGRLVGGARRGELALLPLVVPEPVLARLEALDERMAGAAECAVACCSGSCRSSRRGRTARSGAGAPTSRRPRRTRRSRCRWVVVTSWSDLLARRSDSRASQNSARKNTVIPMLVNTTPAVPSGSRWSRNG